MAFAILCADVVYALIMILFLKHIDIEGSGSLGTFFIRNGFEIKIVELYLGQQLPDQLKNVQAVVALGGPMNVYQESEFPFLIEENIFIQNVLSKKIPFLGICLGSQLLAKATGSKVFKARQEEVGVFKVKITSAGKEDPLFHGLDEDLDVFQWHEDTFDLPLRSRLLVQASQCHHQAFCVGDQAYGLQFHIEVDRDMVMSWMNEYWRLDHVLEDERSQRILSTFDEAQRTMRESANKLYQNFADIINKEK